MLALHSETSANRHRADAGIEGGDFENGHLIDHGVSIDLVRNTAKRMYALIREEGLQAFESEFAKEIEALEHEDEKTEARIRQFVDKRCASIKLVNE